MLCCGSKYSFNTRILLMRQTDNIRLPLPLLIDGAQNVFERGTRQRAV